MNAQDVFTHALQIIFPNYYQNSWLRYNKKQVPDPEATQLGATNQRKFNPV